MSSTGFTLSSTLAKHDSIFGTLSSHLMLYRTWSAILYTSYFILEFTNPQFLSFSPQNRI